jgi:hypothetical protein
MRADEHSALQRRAKHPHYRTTQQSSTEAQLDAELHTFLDAWQVPHITHSPLYLLDGHVRADRSSEQSRLEPRWGLRHGRGAGEARTTTGRVQVADGRRPRHGQLLEGDADDGGAGAESSAGGEQRRRGRAVRVARQVPGVGGDTHGGLQRHSGGMSWRRGRRGYEISGDARRRGRCDDTSSGWRASAGGIRASCGRGGAGAG